MSIGLAILFAYKGLVAFSLWYEKAWAVNLAIPDAILGICVCTVVMFVLPFIYSNFGFTIRLELVALIPYLYTMWKIKESWEDGVEYKN